MTILNYYIMRTLIKSTLLVLLVIVGLDFFIQCLREFHHINQHYSLKAAWVYVLLTLPSDSYTLCPAIVLMGTTLGLGTLSHTRELLIMRASGSSLNAILLPVWGAVIVLLIGMMGVGEAIAPSLTKLAVRHKTTAISQGKTLLTSAGIWIKSQQDFIHISQVVSNQEIAGVTRYHIEAPSGRLRYVAYAQKGKHQTNQWVFYDIVYSRLNNGAVSVEHYNRQIWPVHLDTAHLTLAKTAPNQKTLYQLYKHLGQADTIALFSFWQRLFQPLLTLVLVTLAAPFVILEPWHKIKSGSLSSVVKGLALGLSIYSANQIISPLAHSSYSVSPFVVGLAPLALALLLLPSVVLLAKKAY